MNNKLLVTCGCSFTYGSTREGTVNIPYGNFLAEKMNYRHLNLSRSGASNYFIAKQVEHSLNLNPDLVCIGVTTPLRFEFLENIDAIKTHVSYHDFKTLPYSRAPDKIESRSILYFESQYKNSNNTLDQQKRYCEIFEFLTNHVNYWIKQNQDKFIILGSCFKLGKKNIPYVIIDFDNLFKDDDHSVLNLSWRELCKMFPCKVDKWHFNQLGQMHVADKIFEYIKLNYAELQTSA